MGWGILGDAAGAIGDVAEGVVDRGSDLVDGAVDVGTDLFEGAVDATVDVATGAAGFFGDVADGIIDLGSSLGDALSGLWDRATSWLGGLVGELLGGIVDAFNWVVDQLSSWYGRYWEVLKALVEGFNAPDTLAETAEAWRSGPVVQLSGLGEMVSAQALQADQGWGGPAGQAYASTIPAQTAAVTAMGAVAETTAATLTEASEGLKTLYAEAGGITGRVYAAVHGSPGQLFSMEALLDVVGPSVFQLQDIVSAVSEFASSMRQKQTTLAEQVNQDPAFPGGVWPQATLA